MNNNNILFIISFISLLSCTNNNKLNEHDMFKASLENELKNLKWEEPNKIISLIEPSIVIRNGSTKSIIGGSRLGGQPDLPESFEWPTYENQPMVFFGQINLNELTAIDVENILPKKGILYFFSYFKNPENKFGAEYSFLKNRKEYKVIYFDGALNKLKVRDFPNALIKDYHFSEMPIKFELKYQVPMTSETWKVENANLSENDSSSYSNYIYEQEREYETILGTPSPIQYGAEYDWAYSYLDTIDYKSPEVKELRTDFINLLSFSMMDRFESIGASNCYFGIRKKDLEQKKFENVIFILQDT